MAKNIGKWLVYFHAELSHLYARLLCSKNINLWFPMERPYPYLSVLALLLTFMAAYSQQQDVAFHFNAQYLQRKAF